MASKKLSSASNVKQKPSEIKPNTKVTKTTKYATGDCGDVSESTFHTQYFVKKRKDDPMFTRITREKYYGLSSDGSDTFGCVHGPEGKLYTESEQLERALHHELDPVPAEREWIAPCPPAFGWDMAKKLEFLVMDAAPLQQLERLNTHLRDFVTTSQDGYRIDVLESVAVILDFLESTYVKEPILREGFVLLLKNIGKPVILIRNADMAFDNVTRYIGFIGCLLLGLEEDELFAIVGKALLWHLSAPDKQRPSYALRRRSTLLAAAPALYHAAARMLAVAPSNRFPVYLQMALLLAGASHENCIELLKENILENLFYRFNPYFPERKLPAYDINPADPQHHSVQLGDSIINLPTTLTLLLVLVKTLKKCREENPKFHEQLPSPDDYAQRCFIWAYRYTCRARALQAERTTMTVVTSALLRCFGQRLATFSSRLMPDVMSLSVATEIPIRTDWVATVNFNTSQPDVLFKKALIYLSVDCIQIFPCNRFLIESQHWFVGLMCLLDPGLMKLRPKWSQPLYDELKQTALQALVCVLPLAQPNVVKDCGSIRRIMWYVEWYSLNPYELGVLYWCLRLMLATTGHRGSPPRKAAVKDLFETHGVIILMNLCTTLVRQRDPPIEMSQVVLSLILRVLASGIEARTNVKCGVYPQIVWPTSINILARTMLTVIMHSLERNYIISDRWLISLLNFIWEGIIWRDDYRKQFLANSGVYQLLDLITMVRAPVQCVALALLCDVTSAGGAVSQLVSWRAGIGASNAHPRVVKTGATIACLLASVFRDECRRLGVKLNEDGVIQQLSNPLKSARVQKVLENPKFDPCLSPWAHNLQPICYAAGDLAGSRMSKAYALLQMLSEDLEDKVLIADEAYNLYKNIKLAPKDEVILILCSHFLTEKLMETWIEIIMQCPDVELFDDEILDEFFHINRGWTREIQRQQEVIVETDRQKKHEEECSLYAFLARVRLNTALDALREVRGGARASSRSQLLRAMIADAVAAHHRRVAQAAELGEPVLRTYKPPLDDQNTTAQYVKTYSIPSKMNANIVSPATTLMSVYDEMCQPIK